LPIPGKGVSLFVVNVIEGSIPADAESAEALAGVLNEYAYGGAVIEQVVTPEPGQRVDPAYPFTVRVFLLADEELDQKRRAVEEAVWRLGLLRPLGETQWRELAEEDYANAWKKFYSILHVGERIVIKPSWLEYAARKGEVVIELDPGMAFGTGLHPTTRLCLALIEKYIAPGARVIDVGTGSGILAIGAARLGAEFVDARDVDPIAVETARRNVELAGLGARVVVKKASVTLEGAAGDFDLVLANIFADTIAELAPALTSQLKPDGKLIASGILSERAAMVEEAMAALGFWRLEERAEEDWLALVYAREGR
jgi:ribosomal protein L11 methyltransferase